MSKQSLLQALEQSSYLSGPNAAYIEALYEDYLKDPSTVNPDWQSYFSTLFREHRMATSAVEPSHQSIQEEFKQMAKMPHFVAVEDMVPDSEQEAVDELITAYRTLGHLQANINPLKPAPQVEDKRLSLDYYQLSSGDLSKSYKTRGILAKPKATLAEIHQQLKQLYCGTMGIEYSYILDRNEHEWVQSYIEQRLPQLSLSSEVKRHILKKLIAADGLEKYLEAQFKGKKRFSGEGADSLIPMLDALATHACTQGVQEVVMCMAHRARLNVLINTMGQSPHELFQEFAGNKEYGLTTGDVEYHLGYASDVNTAAGPIHLSLAFNPSHLEFINPVVMGSVRARQDHQQTENKLDYALAVVMHGDAAFAGQGIVMETLSMSKTRAYDIGGSIHIIINNQIGFTTSDPRDLRSSRYCSDLAKMIEAPIIHVNGDDPEAAVKAVMFAVDYRMTFKKDVVIDLVCYRRHGHQEVDEPRATQPLMYQIINQHPTPRQIYAEQLAKEKVCTLDDAKLWLDDYRTCLDEGQRVVDVITKEALQSQRPFIWSNYINKSWMIKVDTTVAKQKLLALGKKIITLPENFNLQRNVQMLMDARRKMTAEEIPLDWGYAETLAYASLLTEHHLVRISGEDARRGTFFHRHATLFDQKNGQNYTPLEHLADNQSKFYIYDSLLSEAGPLGFECGYAAANPLALVIWEAQYGDFVNGAQVIIDQFISSGYQKWNRLCGLVMFLPHGHEGAGPEHTSARLERFLQLCAQDNIQVFVPSTPAQIFHLLRRQILRPLRTTLVVMTPKSLLRHKLAVSTFEDLSHGQLHLVIPEIDAIDIKKVTRVILCSGKVYYDLLAKRRELGIEQTAIIRIEQLYPFPDEELTAVLADYASVSEFIWCQEEPQNQGAWFCTRHRIERCLPSGKSLTYAGRPSMAAPAVGYTARHQKEQNLLVCNALGIEDGEAK